MPSSIVNNLPSTSDFTQIDTSDASILINDPNLTRVSTTGVQYDDASVDNPAGTWVVNGQTVNAGTLVGSLFYRSFLDAETQAGTHLSAMNVNTAFAKAAASLSSAIGSATGTNLTRANLVTLAGPYVADLGITADAFITQVLPNVSGTYSNIEFKALTSTVDQYSNNKLTDNSILQSKFNVATSNRTMAMEGLSNLIKGWSGFLQTLERNI